MAANEREFTLIGRFDDKITKNLQEINKLFRTLTDQVTSFNKEVGKISASFDSAFSASARAAGKLTTSLEDSAKAAGKVVSTVSQIGEGVKGLDGIGESLEAAARAAGRAQEGVAGIGEAAGKANAQAEDLVGTLLKAEAFVKVGEAMAEGFSRGFSTIGELMKKTIGIATRTFNEAREDELSDIKAASGIQGSFGLAGYQGEFSDAQRMYKAYDRQVSEMIRQSSAPTSKVIELQRYTLDTIGPLMLAAEGVAKGTAMKDIDPKKIENSAKTYGKFLEKVAILGQGTGSDTVRISAGIEQLITQGKIDTTIDFFSDNVMLMKNLQAAGFAGKGERAPSAKLGKTEAERMKAMMDAFTKSMSGEATAAMASTLTGSLQGLEDTIFNPSVGILGMATTFGKDTQKKVNQEIVQIQNARIAKYQKELEDTAKGTEREKQLRISIEQAQKTRDQLVKEGEERITNPFQAFSYAFGNLVRSLTGAINAVGPIWESFAPAMLKFSETVLGPLSETLNNVASDLRGKKYGQAEGMGRIVGEIFKTLGTVFADIAKMISDPKGAMNQVQSEFIRGFMAAFKEPGSLEKAKKGISDGVTAIIKKLFQIIMGVITFDAIRPLVLVFIAAIFGPPLISAMVAALIPIMLSGMGGLLKSVFKQLGKSVVRTAPEVAPEATKAGGKLSRMFVTPAVSEKAAAVSEKAAYALKAKTIGTPYKGPIGPVPEGTLHNLERTTYRRPGLTASGKVEAVVTKVGLSFAKLGENISKIKGFGAISKLGKGLGTIGKAIPGIDLLFAAGRIGLGMAGGERKSAAIGGGVGGLIGGVAGGALGAATGPLAPIMIPLLSVVGAALGDMIGTKLGPALMDLPKKLGPFIVSVSNWFKTLPEVIGGWIGRTIVRIGNWFQVEFPLLGERLKGALNQLKDKVVSGTTQFLSRAGAFLSDSKNWAALGRKLLDGVRAAIMFSPLGLAIRGGMAVRDVAGRIVTAGQTGATVESAVTRQPKEGQTRFIPGAGTMVWKGSRWVKAAAFGSSNPFYGSLGEAINFEMANKPSGSHLVIANSSETIIPAAGGFGDGLQGLVSAIWGAAQLTTSTIGRGIEEMTRLSVSTMSRGFESSRNAFVEGQKLSLSAIDRSIAQSSRESTQILQAIKAAAAAGGFFGGDIIGGAKGSLQGALRMAQSLGLVMTSYTGGKHAAGSYHYQGRAMDFGGDPGAMNRLAASLMRTRPTELIHAPGYSMKNGRVVPPSYWGEGTWNNHYDHVHVAYAYGPGKPALFSSQVAAEAWERKMIPSSMRVKTITTNSGEANFGSTTIHAPITIYQQPHQDAEQLASMVAIRIGMAIDELRTHS